MRSSAPDQDFISAALGSVLVLRVEVLVCAAGSVVWYILLLLLLVPVAAVVEAVVVKVGAREGWREGAPE